MHEESIIEFGIQHINGLGSRSDDPNALTYGSSHLTDTNVLTTWLHEKSLNEIWIVYDQQISALTQSVQWSLSR